MLSGAYLGERLSPASSSAALTAALAGVEQHDFQLRMWRTTPLPLALSLVFYGGISLLHPIQQVDQTILRALEEGFDLSWTVVLPAVILLVLPFFKVSAARSILVSCGAAAVLAVWEQGQAAGRGGLELRGRICGGAAGADGHFVRRRPVVHDEWNVHRAALLRLLRDPERGGAAGAGEGAAGAYGPEDRPVCDYGGGVCGLRGPAVQPVYRPGAHRTDDGESFRRRREGRPSAVPEPWDTAIVLAAVVPWSIAGSVPLEAMGASALAIPFSFFLFAAPVCDWLCHRKQFQME